MYLFIRLFIYLLFLFNVFQDIKELSRQAVSFTLLLLSLLLPLLLLLLLL